MSSTADHLPGSFGVMSREGGSSRVRRRRTNDQLEHPLLSATRNRRQTLLGKSTRNRFRTVLVFTETAVNCHCTQC